MTRIAHITDLHFGAEDPDVVAGLAADIDADPPDLVAVSGDLTMGARPSEFRAARAFLDGLRAPWLAVPGNHDISPYNLAERFTDPYRRWRRMVSVETEPMWRDDEVAVLGLNSARRIGLHWDWSRGRFTAVRLRRIVARLDALPPSVIRVVMTHHPLLPPDASPDTPVAGGASNALAVFGRHGVALVLAGHLHRGYSRLATPTGEPPLVLQGATATSVRLRGEPNAYNRISFEGGIPHVEIRVWQDGTWRAKQPG